MPPPQLQAPGAQPVFLLSLNKYNHFLYLWENREKNKKLPPWLVWLSGLRDGLRIKGSPVWFPV